MNIKTFSLLGVFLLNSLSCSHKQESKTMDPIVIKPCTFEYFFSNVGSRNITIRVPLRVQEYINYVINQQGKAENELITGSVLISAIGYFNIQENSFHWISRQGFSKPSSLSNQKTLSFGWIKQDGPGYHSLLIAWFPYSDDMDADGLVFYAPCLSDSNAPKITDYNTLTHLSKKARIKKFHREYTRYFQYLNEKLKDWKPE